MLINHQDLKTNQTLRSRFPAPLPGSVNDNVPVSANVHLYADPDSYLSDTPILYADCEGLEGGEGVPRAEAYRYQDGAAMPHAQRKDSDTRGRKKLHRKGNHVSRNLKWAHGDKEKSKREYAVTELYPKLLYTFSDVVVFVLRNPKYACPNAPSFHDLGCTYIGYFLAYKIQNVRVSSADEVGWLGVGLLREVPGSASSSTYHHRSERNRLGDRRQPMGRQRSHEKSTLKCRNSHQHDPCSARPRGMVASQRTHYTHNERSARVLLFFGHCRKDTDERALHAHRSASGEVAH